MVSIKNSEIETRIFVWPTSRFKVGKNSKTLSWEFQEQDLKAKKQNVTLKFEKEETTLGYPQNQITSILNLEHEPKPEN